MYLTKEYLEGQTLRELLQARGTLPADETIRIVTQVLSALAVAHQAGAVHRDVKPGNIMGFGSCVERSDVESCP